MFYKITKFGDNKYSSIGMVEIMAAFFLEKGDKGWDKYNSPPPGGHLVTLPVMTEKDIYEGKVDGNGYPVDQEDYDKWVASFPTEQRLNPFCNHSIQFEPDQLPCDENGLTEEAKNNIDYCFQYALAITARNYLIDDLHCLNGGQLVNQHIIKADFSKISKAKNIAVSAKKNDLSILPMKLPSSLKVNK